MTPESSQNLLGPAAQSSLLPAEPEPELGTIGGSNWRLHSLQLYNWGAFGGLHRAEFDPHNSAIIGATGSGKTTLVDALVTLLSQYPRYNLASTGGHESDRDLMSYVRGASGPGHAGGGSDHLARSGRCVTGLAAEFRRDAGPVDGAIGVQQGDGDRVLLGALFWLDGSSQALADLGRRWMFAQGPGHSLEEWLEEHHDGGARALGRLEKTREGLRSFASKSAYLARVQSFFEVGPNAFTLLNRAAGLKQLNSIDEIFRELVLDDHSAFDEALQVAAGFDELAAIHAEMELAHRQHLSLLPLKELDEQHRRQQKKVQQWQLLQQALPGWLAQQGLQLWQARCAQLQSDLDAQQLAMEQAEQALRQAQADVQARLEAYLQAGGSDIELLQDSVARQSAERDQRQQRQQDYRQLSRNLGLGLPDQQPVTATVLAQHQAQAGQALSALQTRQAEHQKTLDAAIAQHHNQGVQVQQLEADLQAVQRSPGSNLPPRFQEFRADLAHQLRLKPEQLPFVAELVQVPPAHQAWRGAIERALGSQRLRLLVPAAQIQAALQWVNQRHNRLHVRLLEVPPARADETPPVFWDDGYARRLQLKPHPLQHALHRLLAEHDRHCVDHPRQLQHTPHAMTREGLMSGRARHFDKQDQKALDQDWLTGFDNRDRLAQLQAALERARQEWKQLREQRQREQQAHERTQQQVQLWQQLLELDFAQLDVIRAQADLQRLQQRLKALLAPDSDTALAQQRWQDAQQVQEQADQQLRSLQQARAVSENELKRAQQQHQQHQQRLNELPPDTPAWSDALAQLLQPKRSSSPLPRLDALDCEQLPQQERQLTDYTHRQAERHTRSLEELHKDIIRQMARAQKEDRGHLVDEPQEVAALPAYLQRLQVLQQEALPEKRQRFQEYLNNTSDQGVSVLLNRIDAQVAEITDRLEQLNQTLARVDFQSGRYLQLVPQPVVHPSLQALHKTMAQLRSERLRDDDGTSHYRALQAMVELLREHAENRRTKAAQALLDPRYRLQFAVHVLDRATGQVLERRTGSQGGSGGEKEIIASYVLTASLSYALCPAGRQQPLFATIVLDEAFSKSSQAVAARIIQALQEFGLHALFVTPNKELQLLRQHTRSAVVVHRQGEQARLLNLSWQELLQRQDARRP